MFYLQFIASTFDTCLCSAKWPRAVLEELNAVKSVSPNWHESTHSDLTDHFRDKGLEIIADYLPKDPPMSFPHDPLNCRPATRLDT